MIDLDSYPYNADDRAWLDAQMTLANLARTGGPFERRYLACGHQVGGPYDDLSLRDCVTCNQCLLSLVNAKNQVEADRGPVVVELNVEGFGQSLSDTYEIGRAEWNAMSQDQRVKLVDDVAETFATNYVGWGWHIADPADYAAAVGE